MYVVSSNEIADKSLKSWLVFFNERAPPLVYLLLAAGPCLSGLSFTAAGGPGIQGERRIRGEEGEEEEEGGGGGREGGQGGGGVDPIKFLYGTLGQLVRLQGLVMVS